MSVGDESVAEVRLKYIKRTGKCEPEKCNSACCRLTIVYELEKGPETDWAIERGEKVINYGGKSLLLVEHPCRHLGADLKCEIYEERPLKCRAFPSGRGWFQAIAKAKGCTFSFEDREVSVNDE